MDSLHILIEPTLITDNIYIYEIPRHGDVVDNIITTSNVELYIAGTLYDHNNIKINLLSLGYHSCKLIIKSNTKPNVKIKYILYDDIGYRMELARMPWILYSYLTTFKIQENIKLSLINNIFNAFMSTNYFQGKRYTLEELIKVTRKQHFRFEYLNTIYLATVAPKVRYDATWIHIKLCHNRFKYILNTLQHTNATLATNKFILLPPLKVQQQSKQLSDVIFTIYNNVSVSYNMTLNHVEIRSYSSNDKPHMLITFEHGYPYKDDDAILSSII